MSGDTVATLVGLLGALVLVGSGLWRRRLGSNRMLRLALMWVGIFALVWAAVTVGTKLQ